MKTVPDYIAAKARARVEASKTKINEVIEFTEAGRPLDAEPDTGRKLHRLQRVAGVDVDEAERLVNYDESALSKLAGDKRLGAERIQGKTEDFVGVAFLELARTAASAVGRVVTEDFQAIGSGFMISDRLFLTNNHVISDIQEGQQYLVEFNYEMGVNRQPKPISRFTLRPDEFFVTNIEDDLDFTIVAVGEPVDGQGRLSDFGYCPLIGSDDKHVLGEFVNIIQHPEGDYKQIVLRENQLVTRLDKVLHYLADTNPGSSGSPVFNDQWEVIALHHWGGPTELVTPDGKPIRKDVNEGVRISKILSNLASKRNKIRESQRILLDAALNPQSRQPSTVDENVTRRISEQAGVSNRNKSLDTISQEVRADGTVAWKIPLEVSVRLVGLSPPQVSQPSGQVKQVVSENDKNFTRPPLEEAIHIDPNYSNRTGYDPDFLLRHSIPLPRLSNSQKREAAKLIRANRGESPYELKYQHFSIIMNADRRMAFFTAVNIDGSKWIEVDRDTGEPEQAEAREKWYQDSRIDTSAQCDQSLFDDQVPERVFDRGHLVRRADPNWGTPNKARRANADTFHFTNCSTQERYFNQNKKHWQGIENYILDNAKAEQKRVTVFTGPVLANDDPDYRTVKVPMQFWKILVRVHDGRVLASALLADQSNRIRQLPERRYRREAFDDMSEIIEYQTSIREIERITGLDFGSLRKYDTFRVGPERVTGNKVRIKSFGDIRLDSSSRTKK